MRNPQFRHDLVKSRPGEKQPSSAWLAAQQVFSGARPPPPTSTAVVVVRKGRAAPPSDTALLDELPQPMPEPVGSDKPARVFRVVSAPEPSNAAATPQPLEDDRQSLVERAGGLPRKRRIHADRRPGPVHALPVETFEGQTRRHEGALTSSETASLKQMLAQLDGVFDEIRRAQAFRFDTHAFATEWQRLSNLADKLHAQIRRN